jgi:S1-C subfamily serine protease
MMQHKPGVAFLFAAALVPAVAAAKTPEQIFQQASQSVIVIHAYDGEGNPINQGGGVVTGRELVTTNCHVIEGAASLEVHYRQQSYSATAASVNEERDLCQVKVPQ